MSPEYAMDGAFSVKSDTYSFGVILLEIISGLRITLTRFDSFPNLLAYVSIGGIPENFTNSTNKQTDIFVKFVGLGVELMARW